MPFIKDNTFKPSLFLRNRHINTLYRFLFSVAKVSFERERMPTKDNDFIDLDFSYVNSDKIVILIHGLEGNSNSNYIHTVSQTLNKAKYDIVAFNMRGCSGEPNKLVSSYHSGKTEDLLEIVNFLEERFDYKQIHIVGYSLGGNLTIKFMGEFANTIPEKIFSAVGISVPCDLKGSVEAISHWENIFYMNGFLKTLKEKAQQKIKLFPDVNIDTKNIKKATNFYEFDDLFTAPINGFINADDYWKKSSCKQFISEIKLPTMLISAKDDSFLNELCYPVEESTNHDNFTFVQTEFGGHLGFVEGFNMNKQRWLENTILQFIQENS